MNNPSSIIENIETSIASFILTAPNKSLRGVCAVTVLLLLSLNPVSARASQASSLKWELVNPFRFFRDPSSTDELRRIYAHSGKSSLALERALQTEADKEVVNERANNPRSPFSGWFARYATNNYGRTCWNPKTHTYASENECSDYVSPKHHEVRIWLDGMESWTPEFVKWFKNGLPLNESEFHRCSKEYQKRICLEIDIPFDQSKSTTITAKLDADEISTSIVIKDNLIVGLGDSFASGEGNPDVPAKFTLNKKDFDWFYRIKEPIESPLKDPGTEAIWLDRECHRSMYSYQFKTALGLALDNPQQAVTFISFACSGAETKHIFDKKQRPKEGSILPTVEKQLVALNKVLSRKEDNTSSAQAKVREIDYVLLSIGGNDIGFADIVANIILHGTRRTIYKWTIKNKIAKDLLAGKSGVIEKALVEPEKGKYRILNKKLLDFEKGIPLKGRNLSRILLTAYPNILSDEKGTLCGVNRMEFDRPFGLDANRGQRLAEANQNIFSPLQTIQQNLRGDPSIGWTVVTDHVEKYKEHGFCARRESESGRTGELFLTPYFSDGNWDSFQPWEYRTYETRQRWVRLPVDSKLSVDQRHGNFDLFFEDDWSTIMHPTAEGHAATADANLAAINRLSQLLGSQ